jgi:hypothetical protein
MAADRRKHVGGNIAYFMYSLYEKTVDFIPWITGCLQKIPRLGAVLFLGGTGNNPEPLELKQRTFLVPTVYCSISESVHE